MTTRARTVRRPPARAPAARRITAWDDEKIGISVADGTQVTNLLTQNVADPEKRGCTLVRLIYHMWFGANAPGAVNGTMRLSIGIGLTSDDAFAAAAVPEATVMADYPVAGWVYRDIIAVMDSVDAHDHAPVEVYRDLRVQRKLDRSSLFVNHEAEAHIGTGFAVALTGIIRCLYKLP